MARNRPDPLQILAAQASQRVPDLVPIRYGRMAVSPFAFFRGAAAVMAADLAGTPHSGLRAQLCGDAHLLNFGLFETPERALVFDLNDFDETLPGPVEWDVKRLAASVEIAGRDLGLSSSLRERAVRSTVRSYREALLTFAGQGHLAVWNARLPAEDLGVPAQQPRRPRVRPRGQAADSPGAAARSHSRLRPTHRAQQRVAPIRQQAAADRPRRRSP